MPNEERDASYSILVHAALNTQRFATVLTHQLTCFSHAEYHFRVTVYRSDVQSEIQSDHNFDTYGFQFFPRIHFTGFTLLSQTHTSIDMHSSCRIPLLCDCLSIWCAIWDTKWSQLWHLRVSIFSPNSFAFIKSNYTDLKGCSIMMYLQA